MRIAIDEAVADVPDAHRWLDRIIEKVEDEWHLWEVTGFEKYGDSSWVRDQGRRGQHVIELFRAAVTRSAYPSVHERLIRVTLHPARNTELEPKPAAYLAEEPMTILVENRDSDGTFLRRVIREVAPSELSALFSRPGKPIRFDSCGGGGQMPEEIQRRCQDAAVRPRLVAIADSDRVAPGLSANAQARRLENVCSQYGVPCWILAKRENENYLTYSLLAARPDSGQDHHRRLECWERLSDDRKDFYDMKRGFRGRQSAAAQGLFDGLSSADVAELRDGFGDGVGQCWDVLWSTRIKNELLERGGEDLQRGCVLIQREV